jgi:hypothetical protein
MSTLSLFAETSKLELLHPITKEPTGFILELVNQDHDDVYNAKLDAVKLLRAKGAKEPAEFALSLEAQIKVAVACIVGWTNTSDEVKKVFEKLGFPDDSFSPEKAFALISMKNAGWIRAQVHEAIGEQERFFSNALIS